jgi:dolichol-phosphate mannosyltransferase
MQDIISENLFLSIVIPTYNESKNILKLIDAIIHHIPSNISTEIIIVDDNLPDGTGMLVEGYIKKIRNKTYNQPTKTSSYKNIYDKKCSVKVIHRNIRDHLISKLYSIIPEQYGNCIGTEEIIPVMQ